MTARSKDGGWRGMFSAASLRRDFLASLVVFLVALPLCMGIAIASGVDPARGLMTGIIGGIVVGMIAGCPLQVSGPAAGLMVLVFDLIHHHRQAFLESQGDLAVLDAAARTAVESQAQQHALMVLGAVVFLAGSLQILAALLRLARWFRAVSPAVVRGMLAGIGILILVSQFHVMVDDTPKGDGVENLLTIPSAVWKAFQRDSGGTHQVAAATGVVTIAVLILWQSLAPKRLRVIPAPLIAVLAATAFSQALFLGVKTVDAPHNLLAEVSLPTASWTGLLFDSSILLAAVSMAAIASAETLLCATAVDQIQDGERTRYNRELMAQGVGNMLCGVVGALPMTGVIVRSSANIQAGGQTRLSAVLHGVWLLAFVAALPFVLAYVPKSALGAILVYTGYKLVNWKSVRELWGTSRSEVGIYLATVITIVAVDLLAGVLVGVVLAAAKLLYTFSHLEATSKTDDDGKIRLKLRGACTFVRLPLLAEKLEETPAGAELHIDLHEMDYIDHACLELLMNWSQRHQRTGGALVIDWESLHARFRRDGKANGNGNGDGDAIRHNAA